MVSNDSLWKRAIFFLNSSQNATCPEPQALVMPQWGSVLTLLVLGLIILLIVVGNVLVILSVFTYKPLRLVQNFILVSLAAADLAVAVLVLPLSTAYLILGRWHFGKLVCKLWLTSDVMCCTASILNLCAIALDRYWAITEPIKYAQERTLCWVNAIISCVWLLSAVICLPPLIGWNNWPEQFDEDTPCQLSTKRGYVIYSSFGSFYIPLIIMTIVYLKIFIANRKRLRERAKANNVDLPLVDVKQIPPLDCQSGSIKNLNQIEQINTDEINSDTKNKSTQVLNSKCEGTKCITENLVKAAKVLISNMEEDGLQTQKTTTKVLTNASEEDSLYCRHEGKLITNIPSQPQLETQVYQFIKDKQRISLSKERRAARILGIIMGVFVICWLPFFLMYVIIPFRDDCYRPSTAMRYAITWLGYVNSALNPIIYTIFNMEFRAAFQKLLGLK